MLGSHQIKLRGNDKADLAEIESQGPTKGGGDVRGRDLPGKYSKEKWEGRQVLREGPGEPVCFPCPQSQRTARLVG